MTYPAGGAALLAKGLDDLEVGFDRNGVGQDVAYRRGVLHVLAERFEIFAARIARLDAALHPDLCEAGPTLAQPQERVQVDIAFDLVREVIDFEALGRGVGDEADRIAEAEGGKAELDRVRAQVAAEQDRGLVALELELARVPRLVQLPGVHKGADLGYRVRTRPPGGSRLEGHARDRRLLLDCSDRSHELVHVDAISHCHSRHQISSWPGLAGRIASYPFSDRSMRRPSVSTGCAARSPSR